MNFFVSLRRLMEKCRSGQVDGALSILGHVTCHRRMQVPKHIFLALVQLCMKKKDLENGRCLHALILASRCHECGVLKDHLIRMFACCGSLQDAKQVFCSVLEPTPRTWQAIISAHSRLGEGARAVELYYETRQCGVAADDHVYCAVLQACTSISAIGAGMEIHSHMLRTGFKYSVFVGSALVRMYAKCGNLEDAREVFDGLPPRNVVAWNVMIAGYAENGRYEEALSLYQGMQQEGLMPDSFTLVCLLRVCASRGALDEGMRIHHQITRCGLEQDVFVAGALVNMYAKCGDLDRARKVFDGLSHTDVVTWTAMIGGYAERGLGTEALALYEGMRCKGLMPNRVTFVCLFKACASIGALDEGMLIHKQMFNQGIAQDVVLGNCLVDMYVKCGNLEEAREVFDGLRRDVASWNSIIGGYAERGLGKEALVLYNDMRREGVMPDGVTIVCALKACASVGALHAGVQIHNHIFRSGVPLDSFVGSALLDMYAKCGDVEKARKVFDGLSPRNVVTWNAMIAGYAGHGLAKEALALFDDMRLDGQLPDRVTFVCLLTACSRAGLVTEGLQVYGALQRLGITPDIEHYNCMVDLFGRAGLLERAEDVVNNLRTSRSDVVWMSILGACRSYRNVELGRRAFDSIIQLNPGNEAAYVLLSNMYLAAGRWDDAEEVRRQMRCAGITKVPGRTWIWIEDQAHAFMKDDAEHPQRRKAYAKLKEIARAIRQANQI